MSDIRELLLEAFQVEHKEHLEGIRSFLRKVEQTGEAVGSADLDEVFRRAHSLRAAARVCDLQTVEAVAQRLEALFSQMRKGARMPGQEMCDAVKAALNAIEDWALGLAQKRNPPEPTHALEALEHALRSQESGVRGQGSGVRGQGSGVRGQGSGVRSQESGVRSQESGGAAGDDLAAKVLAAFQVEHRDHLEGIRGFLAGVEQGGAPASAEVDEVFRRAHSLKGAARLAELPSVEALAHRLEALFARVREGTLRLDRDVLRAIGRGLDAIEDCAASGGQSRPPADSAPALEAIEQVLAGRTEEGPRRQESAGASEPESSPIQHPSSLIETVRIRSDDLDRLLRSSGQLLTEGLRQQGVARELSGLSRQIDDLEKEWELLRRAGRGALRELAATPGLGRVARYLALVEQQLPALSRRMRAARRAQQRNAWALELLGGQLQQDARRVRMVSAESVFQGFRKMMRDLARDEGKEIDFRVSGFEIEADRMVLQALKDPLMHVLCNAVSHGLESPEERERCGKNPAGQVTLRLEAPGNRLQVLVEDDGRGIDSAAVAQAAVRRGLLSEAEADAASPEALARLLFEAGFSTSGTVTGLSGRGMGLSVVHETVARLQGEVAFVPREGDGTALVLSVPLSVSTQRLLLVSCGEQTFAVPLHGIERLLRVEHKEVEVVEGNPMLLLQGKPIPLASLAALLEMNRPDTPVEGRLPVMILRWGTRRLAVIVDAFVEERDSLIQELDAPARDVPRFAGGILLEDGSVCLVLNSAEMMRTFKPPERGAGLGPAQKIVPVPARKSPTVLVVDDSLTTRTLEKSILETHGYQVRIAVDGMEALDQLRDGPVDLVITDIQMPRLDGFGLLEEMKKDPRLARVPVIVVTSLGRREDQERGLALGADAYIVKRKFDHQELLDTIRQII